MTDNAGGRYLAFYQTLALVLALALSLPNVGNAQVEDFDLRAKLARKDRAEVERDVNFFASDQPGSAEAIFLRAVIEEIETRSPVELLAIGIGHDVTRYYRRAVTIVDAEELAGAMTEQLASLFEEETAASPLRRAG